MTRSLHTAGVPLLACPMLSGNWEGEAPAEPDIGGGSGSAEALPSRKTLGGHPDEFPDSPNKLAVAPARRGFTLVEMLIAMAITLVMMAAVTTLFANISNSVRNRRATIEMSNQMRHVRNVLQQDLRGATCPGLTWQRPESNHGYIEIIEGQYRDSYPSILTDGVNDPNGTPPNPELDPNISIIPRNNLAPDLNSNGRIDANEWEAHYQQQNPTNETNDSFVVTTGSGNNVVHIGASGLGDYDDILMLTVRNENEPFVGRVPANVRTNNRVLPFGTTSGGLNDNLNGWGEVSMESPLAEVIWFAIENPDDDHNPDGFFGEPGMRTIYRRTLLIAPWFSTYRPTTSAQGEVFSQNGDRFKAEPGLVRVLENDDVDNVADALAALIAFQDRYDLSVRLEWDPNIGDGGRWKIMANTLGDLTKRENRFGHFGFQISSGSGATPRRIFPYPMVSTGRGYSGSNEDVAFVMDPEVNSSSPGIQVQANIDAVPVLGGIVASYTIDPAQQDKNAQNPFSVRPFAFVDATVDPNLGMFATARAMLNDDGVLVRVVHGPVPLWGTRRGEDVMMTDAMAFDVRVFDPGAPVFGVRDAANDPDITTVVEPCDPGWSFAYEFDPDNKNGNVSSIGRAGTRFPLVGQGAYVDMGYQYDFHLPTTYNNNHIPPVFASSSAAVPWFFTPRALSDTSGNQLAPGYAVYDTWSSHYENNGRDDDGDGTIDQGTNGLDDIPYYRDPTTGGLQKGNRVLGPDDVGERETVPPYDKPLRGVQVLVRAYERDSRAIRQVRVSQHFMPE